MNVSKLTQSLLREFLHYDKSTGIFTWRKASSKRIRTGDVAGYVGEYVFIRIFGELHRAHRLAWLYVKGRWPNEDIDHVDRDKTNNAFSNLREASDSQNLFNASLRSDNSSGVKGVSFSIRDRRWRAYINRDGKHQTLGSYMTKAEAISARRSGELSHEHSEYMQ